MIPRTLEPEVMDTAEDAREYDAMDHASVNEAFVADLLRALGKRASEPITLLDLGAGTAQIPIELCRRAPQLRVVAVDAAEHMLVLAKENVGVAGLAERIELVHADAKRLPFPDASFDAVISNSILHHIPEPREVIAEAVRIITPGGLQFHRDLCRPASEAEVDRLVAQYAAGATPYQKKLFAESFRAALTVAEMQSLIAEFGFTPESVRMTSDRHWTWVAQVQEPD
jgi:ubiquinone/menaquinone biosynthesis C-methylase UbiE